MISPLRVRALRDLWRDERTRIPPGAVRWLAGRVANCSGRFGQ
jgi:hypothetical protein